jgi:hypothetical protein
MTTSPSKPPAKPPAKRARSSNKKPSQDGSPGGVANTPGAVTPKTKPNLSASSSKAKPKQETKKEDEFDQYANQPRNAQQIDADAKTQLDALKQASDAGNHVAATAAKDKLAALAQQQEKLGGIKTGSALAQARSVEGLTGIVGMLLGGRGSGRRSPKKDPKDPKKAEGSGGAVIKGNDLKKCKTGKYNDLECKGGHKHHVVMDRTYRTGTRAEGAKGVNRIPGTDSLKDGFSVCLSEADHQKIHKKTDPNVSALGKGTTNGLPDGVAKLGDVIDIAMDDLQKMYRENENHACADAVKERGDEHFKDADRNKQVNTSQNPKKNLDASTKASLNRQIDAPKVPRRTK